MVVPVGQHEAAQHTGSTQEGRIRRRGAAEHEVVAAAGAGVATVDHELLGGQAGGPLRVDGGAVDQLFPAARRGGC